MEVGNVRGGKTMRYLRIGVLALLVGCLLAGLFLLAQYNYLSFHIIIELVAVVVALTIFCIGWNTRRIVRNDVLLLLSIAYLSVAILDGIHTLAYRGMGLFPDPESNLAAQFWIAARYFESISLLLAGISLGMKLRLRPGRILAAYLASTVVIALTIFPFELFPVCYVEAYGLTAFKVSSEFTIVGILTAAGIVLWNFRALIERRVLALLLGSIGLTILSEMAFTLYTDVYDIFNIVGHLLKFLSFVLIYEALVRESLQRPYETLFQDMTRSQSALRRELKARVRAQSELRKAKEQAEAASRAKGQFLANMSHEVRTPMNAILGMTDFALHTNLDAQQRDCLSAVKSSAESLLALLNDVLDVSKIEAGRLELRGVRPLGPSKGAPFRDTSGNGRSRPPRGRRGPRPPGTLQPRRKRRQVHRSRRDIFVGRARVSGRGTGQAAFHRRRYWHRRGGRPKKRHL